MQELCCLGVVLSELCGELCVVGRQASPGARGGTGNGLVYYKVIAQYLQRGFLSR